jgi:hypothetical protein
MHGGREEQEVIECSSAGALPTQEQPLSHTSKAKSSLTESVKRVCVLFFHPTVMSMEVTIACEVAGHFGPLFIIASVNSVCSAMLLPFPLI